MPPADTFPWGSIFFQHEHALVTVDDDCKMILWDQYGDVAEQGAVNDASIAMIATLCGIGVFPPGICATFGIGIEVDPNGGAEVETKEPPMIEEDPATASGNETSDVSIDSGDVGDIQAAPDAATNNITLPVGPEETNEEETDSVSSCSTNNVGMITLLITARVVSILMY